MNQTKDYGSIFIQLIIFNSHFRDIIQRWNVNDHLKNIYTNKLIIKKGKHWWTAHLNLFAILSLLKYEYKQNMNSSSECNEAVRSRSVWAFKESAKIWLSSKCLFNLQTGHTSVRGPAQVVSSNLDLVTHPTKRYWLCVWGSHKTDKRKCTEMENEHRLSVAAVRNNETHGILTQTHRGHKF